MADVLRRDIETGVNVRYHDIGGNIFIPEVWVDSGTIDANVTGFSPAPPATIVDGRKVVTTAGTAVAIAASTACTQVQVTALSTNSQLVVVGASTVVAAAGTRRGTPLSAGQSTTIPIDNLSRVFIDSLVNGEGVSFLAVGT